MKTKLFTTALLTLVCSANAFATSTENHNNANLKVTKKSERVVVKAQPVLTRTIIRDDKYLVRAYKPAFSQGKVFKPVTKKNSMPNHYITAHK